MPDSARWSTGISASVGLWTGIASLRLPVFRPCVSVSGTGFSLVGEASDGIMTQAGPDTHHLDRAIKVLRAVEPRARSRRHRAAAVCETLGPARPSVVPGPDAVRVDRAAEHRRLRAPPGARGGLRRRHGVPGRTPGGAADWAVPDQT